MSRAAARLGRRGERCAARYLRRRGLRIIERNWRCRSGELDIVARDGDVLVVVEVRSARTDFAGGPEHTVGPAKQRQVAQLTQRWLRASRWRPAAVRFDVVAIVFRGWLKREVRWYPKAFSG